MPRLAHLEPMCGVRVIPQRPVHVWVKYPDILPVFYDMYDVLA